MTPKRLQPQPHPHPATMILIFCNSIRTILLIFHSRGASATSLCTRASTKVNPALATKSLFIKVKVGACKVCIASNNLSRTFQILQVIFTFVIVIVSHPDHSRSYSGMLGTRKYYWRNLKSYLKKRKS